MKGLIFALCLFSISMSSFSMKHETCPLKDKARELTSKKFEDAKKLSDKVREIEVESGQVIRR